MLQEEDYLGVAFRDDSESPLLRPLLVFIDTSTPGEERNRIYSHNQLLVSSFFAAKTIGIFLLCNYSS